MVSATKPASTTAAAEETAYSSAETVGRRATLGTDHHAQDGRGEVVEGAALVGGVDQAVTGRGRVVTAQKRGHLVVLEHVVETVAADQQRVVAEEVIRDAIDGNDQLASEATRQHRLARVRA